MKKGPVKDNSERYLLTYADLMNLLLILFIVLYSMSKTDVQKATAVAEAIRKGFNASVATSEYNQSPLSSNTTSTAISGAGDYSGFYDKLIALINQAGLQNEVTVTADSADVVITLKDTALYQSGSATMSPEATSLMTSIAGLIKQIDYALIMIDGYTDTDPIHTSQYPDNLALSTDRASNVFRLFLACGLPPEKMNATGYGEWHPVVANDTSSNKALNRRVVLTIFKSVNNLTPTQIIAAKELLTLDSSLSSQLNAALSASAGSAASASSGTASQASSSSKASSKSSSKASSKTSSRSSASTSSAKASVP